MCLYLNRIIYFREAVTLLVAASFCIFLIHMFGIMTLYIIYVLITSSQINLYFLDKLFYQLLFPSLAVTSPAPGICLMQTLKNVSTWLVTFEPCVCYVFAGRKRVGMRHIPGAGRPLRYGARARQPEAYTRGWASPSLRSQSVSSKDISPVLGVPCCPPHAFLLSSPPNYAIIPPKAFFTKGWNPYDSLVGRFLR